MDHDIPDFLKHLLTESPLEKKISAMVATENEKSEKELFMPLWQTIGGRSKFKLT